MRRLLLLRHAKSSWEEEGLSDFDRPLAPRGRRAADLIGEKIGAETPPDHILCSSARRARETLAALLPHLPGEPKIRLAKRLYEDAGSDYRAAIGALGEGTTLLVIGHNPAVAATVLDLAGKAPRGLLKKLAAKFPTAGLAILQCDIPAWTALDAGIAKLAAFVDPRTLADDLADDGD